MKKRLLLPILTASAVVMAWSTAQAAEPIRIGAVLSVTGPAAIGGEPELKTLDLYIKKINAAGGVLGRPLQLIEYDDATSAGRANAMTKRLIEDDKAEFIIGGTTTGASLAMMPLVEHAGVPFISLAGAIAVVEPVRRWTFKVGPTDRAAADKVFEDAKGHGWMRFALVCDTSGFGQSGCEQAKHEAGKYGIRIVDTETYDPKDSDVTPQLMHIKDNASAQATLVFGVGPGPVTVTRDYRQLGIRLPLYQSHGAASIDFVKLAGAASEGVRVVTPPLLLADSLPDSDPQKAMLLAYKNSYETAYKQPASTFGGYAYDALTLLVDAIRRAKTVNQTQVRNAIEHTNGLMTTSGYVHMSATDHVGLASKAFLLAKVHDGRFELAK